MYHLSVNKMLKRPMYQQIVESLRKSIAQGNLRYGDRLPTEKEVCDLLEMSVIVVKQAYDILANEGLIERIKGKGTFVTARSTYTIAIDQFYRHDEIWQIATKRKLVLFDVIHADSQVYPYLKLVPGEKCTLFKNVVYFNRTPMYFQKVYLPVNHFDPLQVEWVSDIDLLTLLNSKGKSPVHHMMHHFSPITLSPLEADILQLPAGSGGHLMRTQLFNAKDEIIGYVINVIPGQFIELEVNVR